MPRQKVNFEGHDGGRLAGDFANTNFSSNVDDLVKAAEFLRNEYRAPSLVIGHSLGGTAALAVANSVPECKGVVTIAAPHDPEHITTHFKDSLPAILEQGEAEKIYKSASHPKSFISLDKADHLLTDKADAEYVASMIAAWATRYLDEAQVVSAQESSIEKSKVFVGEHNRQFTRTVQTDNHHWFANEPTSAGGLDLGPDPYEHLLAALGTCTSMTIRMYANRKQLPMDDVNVILNHDRRYVEDCEGCDDEPRKIDVLEREILFKGDLNEEQTKKLLEIADKCPVHRTLTNEIQIKTRLTR